MKNVLVICCLCLAALGCSKSGSSVTAKESGDPALAKILCDDGAQSVDIYYGYRLALVDCKVSDGPKISDDANGNNEEANALLSMSLKIVVPSTEQKKKSDHDDAGYAEMITRDFGKDFKVGDVVKLNTKGAATRRKGSSEWKQAGTIKGMM